MTDPYELVIREIMAKRLGFASCAEMIATFERNSFPFDEYEAALLGDRRNRAQRRANPRTLVRLGNRNKGGLMS